MQQAIGEHPEMMRQSFFDGEASALLFGLAGRQRAIRPLEEGLARAAITDRARRAESAVPLALGLPDLLRG